MGDIAPDIEANNLINTFIQAKIAHLRGYPEMQSLLLTESGLYNNPELLFLLDNVWCDYQKIEQGKQAEKSKRKSLKQVGRGR